MSKYLPGNHKFVLQATLRQISLKELVLLLIEAKTLDEDNILHVERTQGLGLFLPDYKHPAQEDVGISLVCLETVNKLADMLNSFYKDDIIECPTF